MSPIYKIPGGPYIDLDKLVSISDADFVDRMGCGGWFVRFTMEFQLRETPLVFQRSLTEDEYEWDNGKECHLLGLTNGGWVECPVEDREIIIAVNNLQSVINEIVLNWENLKATQL